MTATFTRWVLALAGGLPVLAIAMFLVMNWVDPMRMGGGEWLKLAAAMIMIEFLLLHSGAFMAVGPSVCRKLGQQIAWFFGFALLYGLFFFGIALMVGGRYVIWLLVGVLVSRMLTLLILRDRRGIVLMLSRSAIGMLVLLLTMLVCAIPWPELGIDEDIRYRVFGQAKDMLTEHPERMIAWGASYYLVMSLVEFIVGWNLPDWKEEDVDKSWDVLSGPQ